MTKKRLAAIYTRISDAREGDVAGVTRQQEDCLALADQLGCTVVEVYVDNNVSATRKRLADRPAGSRMLQAIADGEVNMVLAYSADRLYRQVAELDDLMDALGDRPVETVKSGVVDLSTADGRLKARIMATVAQHEAEKRGERVTRAAAQRAKEGRYGGGARRMGYTATADALVPHEADEVAWAYRHVANGGTLESVARRWRETLGKGPKGGEITGIQVREVLLRPMNAGIAMYHDEEVGRTVLPVIIDEETFRTVRAILMDPARRTSRGRPATTLLAGVIKCSKCGRSLQGAGRDHGGNGKNRRERVQIYRCREGHHSKQRDRMDQAVTDLVLTWLEKHADKLTKPAPKSASKAAGKAVQDAEQHRKRLDDLAVLLANGDLTPADYAAATREVRSRLAAVEQRIDRSNVRPETVRMIRSGDIRAAWQAANTDTRRAVIKEIIDHISIEYVRTGPFTMDGVVVHWKE
jgi:site-specific DNA recombinase